MLPKFISKRAASFSAAAISPVSAGKGVIFPPCATFDVKPSEDERIKDVIYFPPQIIKRRSFP